MVILLLSATSSSPALVSVSVLRHYAACGAIATHDFCSNACNEELQSGLCLGGKIDADYLYEGQLLRMSWLPDRCCLIEHLGHGEFRIVEAVNTKLSIGDTFTCHLFINNEPVYLDNLIHNGQGPMRYVAGRQSGVLVEKAAQIQVG